MHGYNRIQTRLRQRLEKPLFSVAGAISERQLSFKIVRLDFQLNSAPKPIGLRNNPSNTANSDSKYVENLQENLHFWHKWHFLSDDP
jgi:hypothetical protein